MIIQNIVYNYVSKKGVNIMFSRLMVICAIALLVSMPQVNLYAAEIPISMYGQDISSLSSVDINKPSCVLWRPQLNNIPPYLAHAFINERMQDEYTQMTNNIAMHILFFENLTYQESVNSQVSLYRDKDGKEWYIRYYRTTFEQIASVTASRIHNIIANTDASNVDIKFVLAQDKKTDKFELIGTATERKDFKRIWGSDFRATTKPSNLEEECAFWYFLGMSPLDLSFAGLDSAEKNIVRVDFDTAFSEPAIGEMNSDYLIKSCFPIQHYKGSPEKFSAEVSRIASDSRISEIVNQAEEALKLLKVTDVSVDFQRIRSFLK